MPQRESRRRYGRQDRHQGQPDHEAAVRRRPARGTPPRPRGRRGRLPPGAGRGLV
ncbi:hypothetical protein C882_3040 [Caenispirillum salinarum AK4]|uniref:Uncharacterized protein n=1 Tax=Caenispirillum salinarum AK4 TaxID=1238182 RepID=K9HUP2_9PROT|nr:hypothetical protein C882_3040 [Caenispirillum salinarum AK4]